MRPPSNDKPASAISWMCSAICSRGWPGKDLMRRPICLRNRWRPFHGRFRLPTSVHRAAGPSARSGRSPLSGPGRFAAGQSCQDTILSYDRSDRVCGVQRVDADERGQTNWPIFSSVARASRMAWRRVCAALVRRRPTARRIGRSTRAIRSAVELYNDTLLDAMREVADSLSAWQTTSDMLASASAATGRLGRGLASGEGPTRRAAWTMIARSCAIGIRCSNRSMR